MTVEKRYGDHTELKHKESSYYTSSDDATGQKASGELLLHSKHSVAPVLGWYVPAGHGEHG